MDRGGVVPDGVLPREEQAGQAARRVRDRSGHQIVVVACETKNKKMVLLQLCFKMSIANAVYISHCIQSAFPPNFTSVFPLNRRHVQCNKKFVK